MGTAEGKEMNKTKIICFANNKGGSGKSTTCSNVAYGLHLLGKKVLLVDGDMQANLSLAFLPEERVLALAEGENNLYAAVQKEADLAGYCVPTEYEGLDLIPASPLMSSLEYELYPKRDREFVLSRCLAGVRREGDYDYILMDAPPALGGWAMNLLTASDYLVIPVEASPWGLFGLANMFDFYRKACEKNPLLSLMGIVVTKVDVRKNYYRQTMETLGELRDVHVFQTCIRMDSSVEWSQDNSKPVMAYKKSSRSAKEYMSLTEEVEEIASGKKQH